MGGKSKSVEPVECAGQIAFGSHGEFVASAVCEVLGKSSFWVKRISDALQFGLWEPSRSWLERRQIFFPADAVDGYALDCELRAVDG